MAHQEDQALLKAYITEWRKFFTQCNYLPTPFRQLETSLLGKQSGGCKKSNPDRDSVVRKVKYYHDILLLYYFILVLTLLYIYYFLLPLFLDSKHWFYNDILCFLLAFI